MDRRPRAPERELTPALDTLASLLDELPEALAKQAFTHASWVDRRADSYERLAFLGDVVLSLSVSTAIYPRYENYGAGRLTKLRAQAVSEQACVEVARRRCYGGAISKTFFNPSGASDAPRRPRSMSTTIVAT